MVKIKKIMSHRVGHYPDHVAMPCRYRHATPASRHPLGTVTARRPPSPVPLSAQVALPWAA
jgi:hypothetical protein